MSFPYFSSERDGQGWVHYLESDNEYFKRWAQDLAVAEITGYNTYRAIELALNAPRWKHCDLEWAKYHAHKIGLQELRHYRIVSLALGVEAEPVEHETTFAELDVNERRSEMRLTSIIQCSSNSNLVELAHNLLVDEAYHCWFTRNVLTELGNFEIPRL
jgi:hypothetical protein